MFTVHCPRHRTEVLLFVRDIVTLRNTDQGIELHWRCRCGETGWFLTGRRPASLAPARAPGA